MNKKFEYFTKLVVLNDIEIEDIAECCLCANNDLNEKWILIISTELGVTDIFEIGPVISSMDKLPDYFTCSYRRVDYSDYKISKIIDKFLNDSSRGITQAVEIDKEEAKSCFVDLARYIK
jgi:hypothetical protein